MVVEVSSNDTVISEKCCKSVIPTWDASAQSEVDHLKGGCCSAVGPAAARKLNDFIISEGEKAFNNHLVSNFDLSGLLDRNLQAAKNINWASIYHQFSFNYVIPFSLLFRSTKKISWNKHVNHKNTH